MNQKSVELILKRIILIFYFTAITLCYCQTERLDLEKDISNWDKYETADLIIYFQPNSIVPDKKEFVNVHQSAFNQINRVFQAQIPKKISMVIWNGEEDANKYGFSKLGFAMPDKCVILKSARQTVGHEMTHVISYYVSKNPQRNRFVNEGIATAFNLSKQNRLEAAKKFKEAQKYTLPISLKEAWNNRDKYPEWVYYSLAGELMRRLFFTCGREKLLLLTANQSYENAVKIYDKDLAKIIEELEKEIN